MKKVLSTIATFGADNDGHVFIQVSTLGQNVFDIELTVDNGHTAIVSTSGFYNTLDGQNGRLIDPSGNNGPRSFRVWNDPQYCRQDRFYITFLGPTNNPRIFAAFSYLE
jgi:hypothetical protein